MHYVILNLSSALSRSVFGLGIYSAPLARKYRLRHWQWKVSVTSRWNQPTLAKQAHCIMVVFGLKPHATHAIFGFLKPMQVPAHCAPLYLLLWQGRYLQVFSGSLRYIGEKCWWLAEYWRHLVMAFGTYYNNIGHSGVVCRQVSTTLSAILLIVQWMLARFAQQFSPRALLVPLFTWIHRLASAGSCLLAGCYESPTRKSERPLVRSRPFVQTKVI